MPYRNVRGVNRGVQDAEELQKFKDEEKRKRREKAKKWCVMIGLTVLEFVLCLICFALAYYYYHTIEQYRNTHRVAHDRKSVRFILEPPAPLAIASVYLTLTYVDLISWHSLRPITYFGWIMVSSSGFLMFLLYAGCIMLSCNTIQSYIAIVFGCITAIVFLADLICMLMSLKRFPVPYWVLKRKYEKLDQCVCTGDRDLEEEEVERPICRCGDHWGEPCTCDDPDTTCGCGAQKKGKPPCECCECAAQAGLTDPDATYDVRSSIVSTMSGRDSIEESRKTMCSQASLPMEEFCSKRTPGRFCIDELPRNSTATSRSTFVMQANNMDPYETNVAPSQIIRKSVIAPSQASILRKSAFSTRASVSPSTYSSIASSTRMSAPTRASTSPTRAQSIAANTRSMSPFVAPSTRSVAGKMASASNTGGIGRPSLAQAARIGGPHMTLTETIGSPSMALASQMAINRKSTTQRKKSEAVYFVHGTTMDDEETVQRSIASKFQCKKKESATQASGPFLRKKRFWDGSGEILESYSGSSTDEERLSEADYSRRRFEDERAEEMKRRRKGDKSKLRFSTMERTYKSESDVEGYMSDPEIADRPEKIQTLPGQVSSLDDSTTYKYYSTKKNVSVSARERCIRRSPSTFRAVNELNRPRTTVEGLGTPRIIRNVSTTVRAVRTLSKVMEADNESRSVSQSDHHGSEFPSECTITIKN